MSDTGTGPDVQGSPHSSPHAPMHATHGAGERPAWGRQFVKFTFYRLDQRLRRAGDAERTEAGRCLGTVLEQSAEQMVTRVYSTAGMRADTDFLVWQVSDTLPPLMDWHAGLLRSAAGVLDTTHSFLSMTMRSLYSNQLHEGSSGRERLRSDGGVDDYLFVYPMVKTRTWYELPRADRQAMMDEHITIGHRYHGIKINTTYSYGLDDQEFVVAFEGNEPGEFLALVRELRDSRASAYTERDTPMFTCRRVGLDALLLELGLGTGAA